MELFDVSMNGLERCLIGNEILELPQELLEYEHIFKSVFCEEMWCKALTPGQRAHLLKLLPTFLTNDATEKQITLRKLFTGDNFKFGNPLQNYHRKLKSGILAPDIAKYFRLCQKAKQREYHYRQQRYYTQLLKQILHARPLVLEAAKRAAPDQILCVPIPATARADDTRESVLSKRTHTKYKRILKEVREECCELDTSSDSDTSGSSEITLYLEEELDHEPYSVVSTLTPPVYNGDVENYNRSKKVVITHKDYHEMLTRHKRRKLQYQGAPEFQTCGLKLQDVIYHVHPSKAPPKSDSPVPVPDTEAESLTNTRKRPGAKDKEPKIVKDDLPAGEKAPCKKKKKATPNGAVVKRQTNDDHDGDDEDEVVDVGTEESLLCSRAFGQYPSFFSLIRDLICDAPERRITTAKLEERVKDWQRSPSSALNQTWYPTQASWSDNVPSALKFMAGDVIGMSEDFIPFVDYKERVQLWRWIGEGRDDDTAMAALYKHWMDEYKDSANDIYSDQQMSPPPPRWRTGYIVGATTDEDKLTFRGQERVRFANPHKAFTYKLHGYEAVVGPVKGVYNKETNLKARDHSLLVKDRPAYVTILTLVRDSTARLPNGEGTRADICELMKDSMYLADGVTDTQLNTVVSGALDRLHYEKDPCVKYDVVKKIWIYLHRGRVEEDFEKIHQAQEKAAKAKRSLQKPKAASRMRVKEGVGPPTPLPIDAIRKAVKPVTAAPKTALVPPTEPTHIAPVTTDTIAKATVATTTAVAMVTVGPVQQPVPKLLLNRGFSHNPKGPNSVAGLLQKVRHAQQTSREMALATPENKPKTAQTIKQLTSQLNPSPIGPPAASFAQSGPAIPQRVMLNHANGQPMALTFLPSTQAGPQQLTFSLFPSQTKTDARLTLDAMTSQSIDAMTSLPSAKPAVAQIMHQLNKPLSVGELIASQKAKKSRTLKTAVARQPSLGHMLLSSSQVQQAQMSAPKLAVSAPDHLTSAMGGKVTLAAASTISQILQSTAAMTATSLPQHTKSVPSTRVTMVTSAGVTMATADLSPSVTAAAGLVVRPNPATVRSMGGVSTTSTQVATPGGLGVVPAQLFLQSNAQPRQQLQQTQSTTRLLNPHHIAALSGGKPGQMQLVKTVISQPGGKPQQTTFLITATPSSSSVKSHEVARTKPSLTKQHGKSGGPVYARIITTPPGIACAPGLRLTIPSVVSADRLGLLEPSPNDKHGQDPVQQVTSVGNAQN